MRRDFINQYMITAFNHLHLDVLNAGVSETLHGVDLFAGLAKNAQFRIVSANLVDLDTGAPYFPPYVILTPHAQGAAGPDSLKVAVTGFAYPDYYAVLNGPDGRKYHYLDPGPIADKVLPEARSQGDVLVVLGAFSEGSARVLADKHPEIDLIITAYGKNEWVSHFTENGVPVFVTGTLGRENLAIDFRHRTEPPAAGQSAWNLVPHISTVNDSVAEDEQEKFFVKKFLDDVDAAAKSQADEMEHGKTP